MWHFDPCFYHFWAFLLQFLAYFWSFLVQKCSLFMGKIANEVQKIPKFVGSFLACPKAWLCIKLPTLAISHSVYDDCARQMPILVQKCAFLAVKCPNDVGKIPKIMELILFPQITCSTIISHCRSLWIHLLRLRMKPAIFGRNYPHWIF